MITMRCHVRNVFKWPFVVFLIVCYTLLVLLWQVDVPQNQVLQWSANNQDGAKIGVNSKTSKFFYEKVARSLNDSSNKIQIPRTNNYVHRNVKGIQYFNHNTTLNDLFLGVKTTKAFHQSRLSIILKTWFILARDQTYFFSDDADPLYISKTRGHLINTNCSSSHNRKALCCKMSVEFDTFLESSKKWFCHFDDDNYVNVPRLLRLLQTYNHQEDWYLGKPSIHSPLEIVSHHDNQQKNISFWFATGGAGFCLSRALALKMLPIASGGKFISIGEKIRLPDDVTMGFIIEHILQKKLTVIDLFHSHFEPMKFLKPDSFPEQISFSYSRFGHEMNVVHIDGFDNQSDPTRFLSLHCHLFPNFSFCPR